MNEADYVGDRETIWGIDRNDRPWFQILTLVGGITGSVILTLLTLNKRPANGASDALAFNIVLGIGASFVASGFIAWGLLQVKELIMSIATWLKQRNARDREKLREEGREEGYDLGYDDAERGLPRRRGTQTPERTDQAAHRRNRRHRRSRRPLQ